MITYRKAEPADAHDVYEISIRFNEFNEKRSQNHKKFFPENWEREFHEEIVEALDDKDSVTYIALDEGKIVGMVYAYNCKKCWYSIISDIYVDDTHRGKGIGDKLFKLSEEWCSQYPGPMRIEVYDWNTEAISFYKKRGFKFDCHVMEKES